MATSRRIQRVNKTVMKEVGLVIMRELKDPRITSLVSVLNADMSSDMKNLKVTVSIYGQNEVNNLKSFEALQSAAGYISSLVSGNLRLRFAPEISFERSHSIEQGVSMYFKLKELNKDAEDMEDTEQTESEE